VRIRGRSWSYSYDANGNTLSKTDSTGTTQHTWDFENRLTQVIVLGTNGGTTTFNGEGVANAAENQAFPSSNCP
jgi:uncharacterized protein RhaS with RHS repeats